MKEIKQADIETAIRSVAATALKNEEYFCELDSFAGDADFGVSLATGFRGVEQDWKARDRSSIGPFLLKISMIITKNVGGCSGPIWGTGFMRAGALSKDRTSITLEDLDKMLTGDIEEHHARGSLKDAHGGYRRHSETRRRAARRQDAARLGDSDSRHRARGRGQGQGSGGRPPPTATN